MKFTILILLILSFQGEAVEANDNILGKNMTTEFGFKQGAFHMGVSYISGAETFGLGGYAFFQSENKGNDVTRANQLIAFGGLSKFNIAVSSKTSVYVSPGVGFNEIRNYYDIYSGNTDKFNKFFFGVIFKIGGLYSVSSNTRLGLEYMKISNWCEAEILDSLTEYTNFVVTFAF